MRQLAPYVFGLLFAFLVATVVADEIVKPAFARATNAFTVNPALEDGTR